MLICRITLALIAAVFIQIIIVCKHFEYRYFVPALMLLPMAGILLIELTKGFHLQFRKRDFSWVMIYLFIVYFAFKQQPVIESLSIYLDGEHQKRMPALYYMRGVEKDAVKFLVPGFYGCPVPEYALMSSYGWAGRQKEFFKPTLGKLYPNTYIYYFWDKTVNFWADPPDFKTSERPVYIYLEHIKHKEIFLADTRNYFPENSRFEQTFFNPETNEVVFRLVIPTSE